jgi:membrane protein DedA with SNARE-associated domain
VQPLSSLLLEHRYAVLLGAVLVEQMGLPVPAAPLLLAAGALAGMGGMSLPGALAISVGASLAADLVWYLAGRRRGGSLLKLLCRVSLEPDSCVRRTETAFARHGARSLLVAKFLPGLNTVAAPMAGLTRMPAARFAACAAGGGALWAGTYLGAGFLFRHELAALQARLAGLGKGALAAGGLLLLAWLGFKWLRRARFQRELRLARITPHELKGKLDAGEDLLVVDLRGPLERDGPTLPGARRLSPEDLETAAGGRAWGAREVVLFCT